MKLLIFSDIHGNSYTLDKLFENDLFTKVDYSVFCGDIFGYYYNQNEIIQKFKSIKNLSVILGNHDKLFLDMIDGKIAEKDLVIKYGKSYSMSKKNLNDKNVEFIRGLNQYEDIFIDSKKIRAIHGSPIDNLNGRIYPDSEMKLPSEYKKYDYLLLGHTHYKMKKKIGKTTIINPGSIGQPRDGGLPSYVIIDTYKQKEDFYKIEYNRKKLIEDINMNHENNKYLIDVLYRGD